MAPNMRQDTRKRRRSFALPFVLTIAAAPGCYVTSGSSDPPATTQEEPSSEPTAADTTPAEPSSEPQAPNPSSPTPQQPPVVQQPPEPTKQPPIVTNNPPPPQTLPMPRAEETVTKHTDGTCWASAPVKCPAPPATCNPPPPRQVQCLEEK